MHSIRPAFIIHHSSFIICLLLAFPALAQNNAKEIMVAAAGGTDRDSQQPEGDGV